MSTYPSILLLLVHLLLHWCGGRASLLLLALGRLGLQPSEIDGLFLRSSLLRIDFLVSVALDCQSASREQAAELTL